MRDDDPFPAPVLGTERAQAIELTTGDHIAFFNFHPEGHLEISHITEVREIEYAAESSRIVRVRVYVTNTWRRNWKIMHDMPDFFDFDSDTEVDRIVWMRDVFVDNEI